MKELLSTTLDEKLKRFNKRVEKLERRIDKVEKTIEDAADEAVLESESIGKLGRDLNDFDNRNSETEGKIYQMLQQ